MTRSHDEAVELTFAVFLEEGIVSGFVLDMRNLDRQFVVELLIDGWPCRLARANAYDQRSPAAQSGRSHGFAFALPQDFNGTEAEVRLANSEAPLGSPIDLTASAPTADPLSPGEVTWHGGLRVGGWVQGDLDLKRRIRGLVEGEIVFDVPPNHWTFVPRGESATPCPAFETHLPARFADGKVHRLMVEDADGTPLVGAPLSFVAFPDGLEAFTRSQAVLESEQLRGRFFDRLVPHSLPFHWFDRWVDRFPVQKPTISRRTPIAVVLFGDRDVDRTLESLEHSPVEWVAAAVPLAADGLSFDPSDLSSFLDGEGKNTEIVVFAFAGTTLEPMALAHFAETLAASDASFAYADVVIRMADGLSVPLAYPAFDPVLFLEQGLGSSLFALHRPTAIAAAHKRATNAFEILALAFEERPQHEPLQIAAFLGTCPRLPLPAATNALARSSVDFLRRSGLNAKATAGHGKILPSVHIRRLSAAESVAVLLKVTDHADEVRATLDALRSQKSRHRIDVHIVDMGSSDEATLRYIAGLRGQREHVFRTSDRLNTARALNAAAQTTRSRFLCFLDAGCIPRETDFFEALVARCIEHDVAAVGPLLGSAGGIVRAAGLVPGRGFNTTAAFVGASVEDAGYADLLCVARSCSALPRQGLLVKKGEFLACGGFDADRFRTFFHSVDLCLGLRKGGKRVVICPVSRLSIPDRTWLPDPSVSDQRSDVDGETIALRLKWGQALMDDPTYSTALNLDHKPYSALAWPPRSPSLHATAFDPRVQELKV